MGFYRIEWKHSALKELRKISQEVIPQSSIQSSNWPTIHIQPGCER